MTSQYLDHWLEGANHYRMQLLGDAADNPDQRIAEDIKLFIEKGLEIGVGLLGAVVTLASFVLILWSLSADAPLHLFGADWAIPGYLVWAALLYAIAGTALTHLIGWPLVGMHFQQQRYEADFRFNLVRVRENSEQIALLDGERSEGERLRARFGHVVTNWWGIMQRTKKLTFFTAGYSQAAVVFPYVVASPAYFSGKFQLGGLMQIAGAFDQVQTALSFVVASYPEIAAWQSVVQRLAGFRAAMEMVKDQLDKPQPIAVTRAGEGAEIDALALDLPDGRRLLDPVDTAVEPSGSLLLVGPTGTGKSTLLRAIAGLWPFGKGRVRLGSGRAMFLPQRPYVPLGSLRNALLYPDEGEHADDSRLREVLAAVGLARFAGELDTVDNWAQRLSLGEQQRLAFARVLLAEPATIFLDEATSALDEAGEAQLYGLLRKAPWRPSLVSVGHRTTLRDFHDRTFDLSRAKPAAAAAAEAAAQ
jgi:putative ATP-binding cassette transporter